MANKVKFLTILLFVALFASCVPSLHPLCTDEQTTFNPDLVGCWQGTDPDWIWNFEKSADANSYNLKITIEENDDLFIAKLTSINETLYLDLYPKEDSIQASDMTKAALIGAHLIIKIHQLKPALKISFMNVDELTKTVKENPTIITHQFIEENRLILTAPTKELRNFVAQNTSKPFLFAEPGELIPCDPNDSNTP
jgi:hypothetical protein